MSVRPSVRPHGTARLTLEEFLWNLFFECFSKTCQEYSSFFYHLTGITVTLRDEYYTFLITSLSVPLRKRNVSDRSCRWIQNTCFTFTNFFSENRAVYEIMWKNMVESNRPQIMVFCSFLFVPYTNPHFWTDLNQTLHTSPPSSGEGRGVCMDPQYLTLFDLFCQEPVQNPGHNMAAGPRVIATALYPWSSRRHLRQESSVM